MTQRASDFGLPEPTPEDQAFWAPHLRDGETLVWAGSPPETLIVVDGLQVFLVPVGVLAVLSDATLLVRLATGSVAADPLHPLARSLRGLLPFGAERFRDWPAYFGIPRPRAVRDFAGAVGATA